jgi:hypothetical protein
MTYFSSNHSILFLLCRYKACTTLVMRALHFVQAGQIVEFYQNKKPQAFTWGFLFYKESDDDLLWLQPFD